jgi:DNA-binding NtrC family response regulator
MRSTPINILAIDDEQLLLWALKKACHEKSIDIMTAATTEEALQAIDNHEFDLYLLDFDLRDQSRVALLREIDELHPFAPIILMTTTNMNSTEVNDIIKENRKHGAWHILEKPFRLDTMISFIKMIFEEKDNIKICLNDLIHNYENEKRLRLRRPHVKRISMTYKTIADGEQIELATSGILTDVSDTGLGLLTQTPLKPDQVVNFGEEFSHPYGVVTWSKIIEPRTYRVGIMIC